MARYSRPCNSVSWSRSETNLLAVGLEKHRSDTCILLWDVQMCSADDFTGVYKWQTTMTSKSQNIYKYWRLLMQKFKHALLIICLVIPILLLTRALGSSFMYCLCYRKLVPARVGAVARAGWGGAGRDRAHRVMVQLRAAHPRRLHEPQAPQDIWLARLLPLISPVKAETAILDFLWTNLTLVALLHWLTKHMNYEWRECFAPTTALCTYMNV